MRTEEHVDASEAALTGPIGVGTRLRCAECGSELIVVGKADAELSCCGRPPVAVVPPGR